MSTHIEKMSLLDQMDPLRLKTNLENKDNCCTHSCKHCSMLMKIPWKENSSMKKGNHGRSYHTAQDIRYLKNDCTEEQNDSLKDSLKAAELKEKA